MTRQSPATTASRLFISIVPALLASASWANHGPGTSGGGLTTMSGETMKVSTWNMDFRLDFTSYEGLSAAQAEAHAANSGAFDSIDSSVLASLSLSYGLLEDVQVSTTIGWYWGNGFIDAEDVGGVVESSTADPSGLTDLWINAKWRVMKGEDGHLALVGGVKAPVGNDDQRLANGELLEPSSQPGSGAWDFMGGVAYSRYLTPHVTLDSSVAYTLRTEAHDFQVGDRFDAGVAVSWRLTDEIDRFPNISVFTELSYVLLMKDQDAGVDNPNSGGGTLYLGPGVRARFNANTALTVAPQFPIMQDLNGDQVETSFKLGAMLSLTF